jgi:hypothetical protein
MTSNYRDGDASNALLNKPSALVHYRANSFPSNETIKYKPFIFKNDSNECLNANYTNYTSCVNNDANDGRDIDNKLMKLIYFPDLKNSTSTNTSNVLKNNNSTNSTNILANNSIVTNDSNLNIPKAAAVKMNAEVKNI